VRGELDWIVMRCLEKDRARRYSSASGLARDIERHLRNEAVEACPPSASYRLGKVLRRHRGTVVLASAIVLILCATVMSIPWGMIRAEQARRMAMAAEQAARAARDREMMARERAEEVRRQAEADPQAAPAKTRSFLLERVLPHAGPDDKPAQSKGPPQDAAIPKPQPTNKP
jgi:hypothetical protein